MRQTNPYKNCIGDSMKFSKRESAAGNERRTTFPKRIIKKSSEHQTNKQTNERMKVSREHERPNKKGKGQYLQSSRTLHTMHAFKHVFNA